MKNIFNLFKKKKAIEENLYFEIFELKGHYVQIEELASDQFKYEVYSNGIDDKRLITGYTNNAGTAYSQAHDFVKRVENIEPIIAEMNLTHSISEFIINRDDAVRLLEEYKDRTIDSLDFYDYKLDMHFAYDKGVVKDIILDGYYE